MGVPEFKAHDNEMESPRDIKVSSGVDEKRVDASPDRWVPPGDWITRLVEEYSGQHGGETLPPGSSPNRIAIAILTMNEDESVKVLKTMIDEHRQDYTFDQAVMRRLTQLVEGNEACEMEYGEWAYAICKMAGLMNNWSPYAEVRAVTLPYDDPEETCESLRAYLLGFFWVCVCTAVNTCELAHRYLQVALLTLGSLCSTPARYLHPEFSCPADSRSYGPCYGYYSPGLGLEDPWYAIHS